MRIDCEVPKQRRPFCSAAYKEAMALIGRRYLGSFIGCFPARCGECQNLLFFFLSVAD
jgi:hypothetical protein